jgi:hypothetical protein
MSSSSITSSQKTSSTRSRGSVPFLCWCLLRPQMGLQLLTGLELQWGLGASLSLIQGLGVVLWYQAVELCGSVKWHKAGSSVGTWRQVAKNLWVRYRGDSWGMSGGGALRDKRKKKLSLKGRRGRKRRYPIGRGMALRSLFLCLPPPRPVSFSPSLFLYLYFSFSLVSLSLFSLSFCLSLCLSPCLCLFLCICLSRFSLLSSSLSFGLSLPPSLSVYMSLPLCFSVCLSLVSLPSSPLLI